MWTEKKKVDPDVRSFFAENEFSKNPPLHRLIPREAVRGGLSEAYDFLWSSEKNPDENFHYVDMVSQYPFHSIRQKYPVGDFQVTFAQNFIFFPVD